jgi:TDG/mug DNA glycosylase family protein
VASIRHRVQPQTGTTSRTEATASGRSFHQAGFTDVRLRPEDERQLLTYRCGITAVVTRPTPRASDIMTHEFQLARAAFEAKIREYEPRVVAFLGKRALSAMLAVPEISWGRQISEFGGATAWVLPNPSGLNRGFTRDALVLAYAELRDALKT